MLLTLTAMIEFQHGCWSKSSSYEESFFAFGFFKIIVRKKKVDKS